MCFCGVEPLSERIRHLYDSHGQILALAFRHTYRKVLARFWPWLSDKSLNPLLLLCSEAKLLPLCSEAMGCVDPILRRTTHARRIPGAFQSGRSERWKQT